MLRGTGTSDDALVYAKVLDLGKQALILRWGGTLHVGVVQLLDCAPSTAVPPWPNCLDGATTELRLVWEWCCPVREQDVEFFMQQSDDGWRSGRWALPRPAEIER
jgi:hypothetical protein